MTSAAALGAGVERSLERNEGHCFGSESLRSPCKRRSLERETERSRRELRGWKGLSFKWCCKNQSLYRRMQFHSGTEKRPASARRMCVSCNARAPNCTNARATQHLQGTADFETTLWFIFGSNLGVTVTEPVWATKKTVHMLRQHVQAAVGLGGLPVNPSHNGCLKWRWGDMEGLWVNRWF